VIIISTISLFVLYFNQMNAASFKNIFSDPKLLNRVCFMNVNIQCP